MKVFGLRTNAAGYLSPTAEAADPLTAAKMLRQTARRLDREAEADPNHRRALRRIARRCRDLAAEYRREAAAAPSSCPSSARPELPSRIRGIAL